VVTLNRGLEEIGKQAFYKCISLVHITTSSVVRLIDETAFWDCKQLMSVILNNGLEEIGKQAFYNEKTLY
jgi:hypothetical protein